MESVLADPSHIIVLNSRELRGALRYNIKEGDRVR
jgi:hypothetical protein